MSSARETLSRREVMRASDDAIRAAEQANATLLRMRDELARLRSDLELRDTRAVKDLTALRERLDGVDAVADAAHGEIGAFTKMGLWLRLRWMFTGRWL